MKIGIASDHRGYKLKSKIVAYLQKKGVEVEDDGTFSTESVDYPVYAFKLSTSVVEKNVDFGIAICGSGIGISIACNKVKGIRCVRAVSVDDAFKGKNHNGANVIALGSEVTPDFNLVKEMIDTFITTKAPSEERHLKRVQAIRMYEAEH